MALSALFLLFFLLQHLVINLTSLISEDLFNSLSQFMGSNYLVQFVLQPVLIGGIAFHFIMGIYLEFQNRAARGDQGYAYTAGNANASWVSKNMILTGLVVLAFLLLHLYQFWLPEIVGKYITGNSAYEDTTRFHDHVKHVFHGDIVFVILYVVSFVLLGMHLNHGFQSSFQSVGMRSKSYTPLLKKVGTWYSVLVPLGFIVIALYHYINS